MKMVFNFEGESVEFDNESRESFVREFLETLNERNLMGESLGDFEDYSPRELKEEAESLWDTEVSEAASDSNSDSETGGDVHAEASLEDAEGNVQKLRVKVSGLKKSATNN